MGVFACGGTPSTSPVPCNDSRSRLLFARRAVFPFSLSIILNFGVVGLLIGGVGGTSPVIRTSTSIDSQSNLNAAIGVKVKTSRVSGSGMTPGSKEDPPLQIAIPESADGLGGRGSRGVIDAST